MNHDKVIEKIKKLLERAERMDGPEADVAMALANKMLLEHSLSARDLGARERKGGKFFQVAISTPRGHEPFHYWAGKLLKDYFLVTTLQGVESPGSKKIVSFLVCGEEHNIKIACYVFDHLNARFYALWTKHQAATGCPDSHYESYLFGLYSGLDNKLREQKSKLAGSKGLIVIESEIAALGRQLDKSCEGANEQGGWRGGKACYYEEAAGLGKKDGEAIEIAPGLGAGAKKAA
jgi:hypothetical protein